MSVYVKAFDGEIHQITPTDDDEPIILNAIKQETIYKVEVTPEVARHFIENQVVNRNLNVRHVSEIANDITNGKWEDEARNLFLFCDNVMYDGNHRCNGIVKANIPVKVWISLGSEEIPNNIDTGVVRSYAHIAKMKGKDKSVYNSFGYALTNYIHSYKINKHHLSYDEATDFIEKHSEDIVTAIRLSKLEREKIGRTICGTATVQTALFFALKSGVKQDVIESFCRVANSGFATANWHSPAILLRNFKQSSEGIENGRVEKVKICNVAQEALYDFARKTPRRRMYKGETHYYSDLFDL